MRNIGGGDARSGLAARLRVSSIMPPDHGPSDMWERQAFLRDKIDCAEREKYISARRDWTMDTRTSSTRSSNTFFSNVGSSDSSAKRRALGRHATIHENGRYESGVSRPSDISSHVRSPPENSKAERDFFSSPGIPSPGYSSSLSMEKPCKDLDGIHLRGLHLPPSEIRPASSPCFDTSPRFDPPSRLYAMQNVCELRERERLKFSSSSILWETPCRDRERIWGRPEYHKRTHSLPKLDSPRDWSGGDGELLEGRIDRYGSGSSREVAFSDVLSHSSKEHYRYDWRTRDRGVFGGFSSRSTRAPLSNSHLKNIGAAPAHLEEPRCTSPPWQLAAQNSFSNQAHHDLDTSLKKRPRLTWGQGLAKYEKEKIDEDHSAEDGHHGVVELHEDMHASSDCQSRLTENGSISPLHNQHCGREQDSCDSGVAQSCDFERSFTPQDVAIGFSLETQEPFIMEHSEDLSKANVRQLSPSVSPSKDRVFAIAGPPKASVLPEVQVFLSNYLKERPTVSKDVLTHHVEKVEQEVDRLEKLLIRLGQEQVEEVVSTHDASNLNIEMQGGESCDTSVSATDTQLTHCEDSSAVVVTCAEIFPVLPYDNAHLQVPEASEGAQMSFKATDESQSDIGRDEPDAAVGVTMSAVKLGELQREGGHVGPDLEVMTSTGKDVGPAESILHSNNCTAQRSLALLAHLESGRLYSSPQQVDVWKFNAESHLRKRKRLEAKVVEEKVAVKILEKALAVKLRAHREAWQQKQGERHFRMEWKKSPKNSKVEETDDVNPTFLQSSGLMNIDLRNDAEVHSINMSKTRFYTEHKRGFLRMPPMRPRGERELHIFETKNGLVDDPVSAEQERKSINPWSIEEKSLFLEKYSSLGKDFRRIASYLEHKTVADCVEFYYRNQKTEEFEKVHQKRRLEKHCSFQLEKYKLEQPAFYLATNSSIDSRYCEEENTSRFEGLSLVAAAAAAMSAPTKPSYRGLATKACLKVAPTQFAVKGLRNVECKGAQITRSRARACNEELDVDWSDIETKMFMNAVVMFGKDFDSISQHMGTRSRWQCRSFFRKARRRLGLDQLVERDKVILQASRVESVVPKKHVKTKPVTNAEIDLPQQQCIDANFSAACFDSAVSAEPLQVSRDSKDAISFESLREIGREVCVSPKMSVIQSGMHTVYDQVKQEACTNSDSGEKGSGDASTCARYASSSHVSNSLDLACGETLQSKTELISVKAESTNLANEICNRGFSVSAPLRASSAVSTLVSNPIPVASAVEATRNKDKVLEMKVRREPTSWTQEEKDKFVEVLKYYGKNWDRLRESLPGKSLTQIKTYFQNSKAKLGFGPEGVVSGKARGSSSRKRKVDDSDSSSNAGSGGPNVAQQVSVHADDGNMKVSPSLFVSSGGVRSHALAAELMYANDMNPLFNPAMLTSLNLQAPYEHPNPMKVQPVELQQPQQGTPPKPPVQQQVGSLGAHQMHQLQQPSPSKPALLVAQELPLPVAQHLHKQCTSEVNQQTLLHQHQQQVAVAVLKQHLPNHVLQGQMVTPQVPHSPLQQMVSQQQAQSSQRVPNQVASQLPQGAMQNTGGQARANNQQLQQQTGSFSSQLYQINIKPPPLLQQQQQLLQLYWQQQAQLQQGLAKQARSQLPYVAFSNEQQQQVAVLNGIMQATSACTAALKQSNSDNPNFSKTQLDLCEVLYQLPSILQGTQDSTGSHAVSESQKRATDVKLFGQPLLTESASSSGKVSTLSSQIVANVSTQPPVNAVTQGLGWPHLVWSAAPFVNGCSSTGLSNGLVTLGNGGDELGLNNLQEAIASTNERLGKSNEDQQAYEGSCSAIPSVGEGPDRRAMSNTLPDTMRQPCDLERPNFESSRSAQDCGTSVNKFGVLNSQPSLVGSGGEGAFQGLPRVLDALAALAEWRIQNANGSTGTDFLSQSWEALQRDPGSLVEAGKTLAQMYTSNGGFLKDGLRILQPPPLHSLVGANGGGMGAGSGGHLSGALDMLSQSSSLLCVNRGHDVRDVEERGVVG